VLEDCLGTESVLIVDDIPEQREIASLMLRKLGYRVHVVAGGEAAIDYLRDKKVDILVLDMVMEPGIDGCETYRRISEIHPNQKAIIASGYSESDRVREARRLGVGEYIQKPYTLWKIARALRAELDR
jgi:CheY-like chemotaxis protein